MGYIIALVLLLLIVPLVFMVLSRRTTAAGGVAHRHRDRGVTVSKPSSDQPEPRSDSGVNEPRGGIEKRLPPG